MVHRALEVAYRGRADGATKPAIERAALVTLDEAWNDERLPDDDTDWHDRAERMVRQTLVDDVLHANDILGVEHRFDAQFDDFTAFAGYADLVLRRDDRTVEIVDHKVTRNVLDARTLQHDRQLNLYGWLAKHEWPWASSIVATQHYSPAGTTTTVDLSDTSISATMRDLVSIARRATNDVEFIPTPAYIAGIARGPLDAQQPSRQRRSLCRNGEPHVR